MKVSIDFELNKDALIVLDKIWAWREEHDVSLTTVGNDNTSTYLSSKEQLLIIRKLTISGSFSFLLKEFGELINLRELTIENKHVTKDSDNGEYRYYFCEGQQLEIIPKELGNLKNLEVLHIRGTRITTLPSELGNLIALKKIIIEPTISTCICDDYYLLLNKKLSLPEEICRLTNLEEIRIRGCGLTELPPEIGNLINLKVLDISSVYAPEDILENNITELPEEICNLTKLEEFYVCSGENKLKLSFEQFSWIFDRADYNPFDFVDDFPF